MSVLERTRYHQPRRFLEWFAMQQTDECLPWPFARTSKGYGAVKVNGKMKMAHRAILELASGHIPDADEDCRHGPCRDRGCCNPRHLSWGSRLDNLEDRRRDGTMTSHERHWNARLSANDVTEIRRRALDGERNVDLAREFGVTRDHISSIKRGKVWR